MLDIFFIMSAMTSNCLTNSLTSCGSTPAPAAMRRRRLWSIDPRRVAALVGGHRVDDAHHAADVLSVSTSPSISVMPPMPGIMLMILLIGPSFLVWPSIFLKSSRVNSPLRRRGLLLGHLVLVELLLGLLDQA